jgi:hypothetical protein
MNGLSAYTICLCLILFLSRGWFPWLWHQRNIQSTSVSKDVWRYSLYVFQIQLGVSLSLVLLLSPNIKMDRFISHQRNWTFNWVCSYHTKGIVSLNSLSLSLVLLLSPNIQMDRFISYQRNWVLVLGSKFLQPHMEVIWLSLMKEVNYIISLMIV